ncbi:MAG: hypothetical protein ABIR46_01100 [Candidatus Saccharimonadales bacterium]
MANIMAFLLQYLGIFSLILIVIIGFFMVRKDPDSDHASISSYAGSEKSQSQLAFLALIVSSIPFYLWIVFWLIPQYQLSVVLYPFLAVSFICHLLLIRFPLIPSNGRKHVGNLLHLGAGSVIAISMLGLLVAVGLSPVIENMLASKVVVLSSALYMFSCLFAYMVTREQKYFFVFEVIYIVLFAVSIGVITFRI